MELIKAWKPIKPGEVRGPTDGYRVVFERLDGAGIRVEEIAVIISYLAEDKDFVRSEMIAESSRLLGLNPTSTPGIELVDPALAARSARASWRPSKRQALGVAYSIAIGVAGFVVSGKVLPPLFAFAVGAVSAIFSGFLLAMYSSTKG